MFTAILVIGGLALFFGALLGYSALRFKVEGNPLAEKVDALLPQSQCGHVMHIQQPPIESAHLLGREVKFNS